MNIRLAAFFVMLHSVFGLAAPASKPQQLTSPDQVPEGLAKSDWSSIRAAYEAGRHAFMPIEGGWQARNPGQQWTTRFDGRGFLTTPRDGGWTWGLELKSYGRGTQQTQVSGKPAVKAEGQRLSYQWDAAMQEWWVNDPRGLEHGYVIQSRPEGDTAEELSFLLGTRGSLHPKVSTDAKGVEFCDAKGTTVLNYTGLKVWDADGKVLPSRFEAAGEKTVRLLVEERGARYPLTIDPIAQQAYLKSGNNGGTTNDQFGYSVAISGDTVVVGAPFENSSSIGVNSTPDDVASYAGAAYVFVRSAGVWTQQAYLKPAAVGSTQAEDRFGTSVAVAGDTVVVGARDERSSTTGVRAGAGTPNENAFGAGAAYVFVRSAGVWTQQAYLKPAAVGISQAGDRFGTSVAIAGDTVVVGANNEDSSMLGAQAGAGTPNEVADLNAGAAYVFARSAGVWTQEAYLKPAAVGFSQNGDFFGTSVAVAGDTVVVGAVGESSSTTGVQAGAGAPNESASSAGAAYVFVRSAGIWTQQAYLKPAAIGTSQAVDQFGTSVAVAGDTVVVGASGEGSSTLGVQAGSGTPNESASFAGAAYIFVRNAGVWSQQAYLKPAAVGTTQAGDQFGLSVAVAGDTVVVGAISEDSSTTGVQAGAGTPNDALGASGNSGAACIFVRSGATWSQEAYAKASNAPTGPGGGDQFGISVAVAGDTVVVGASGEDSSSTGVNSTPDELAASAGAAYIFVRSAGVWTQQAYLKPATVGTTQAGDFFGVSVAVAGDTVVVGAVNEDSGTTGVQVGTPDESATDAGAAYVFVRSAGVWSQQAYLKPVAVGTTQAGDQFGRSVAIAGDTVVVGAYAEDSSTTGVQAGAGTPDESATDAGAAHVFVRSGGVWTQQAYLKPAAVGTTQAGDQFGTSVAVAGDTVIVGAGESDFTTGAAYIFVRSAGVWSQEAYLMPPAVGTTQAFDQFGQSVAVSGDTVVVGAPGEDSSTTGVQAGAGTPNENAENAGAAYIFVRNAGVWTQQAYLKPAAVGTSQAGDGFGWSVAVAGDIVVVGALFADSSSTGVNSTINESAIFAGAAYVFVRSAGVWTQQAYLKPSAVGTTQEFDQFGQSVAVAGDTVVVGATGEDSGTAGVNSTADERGSDAGAAYLFTLPDIDNDGLLDSWEVTQFGTTSGHSPLDDTDHDGLMNLLELGFGLNPTLPNGAALPPATTEGDYLTMTLTKQPGVTYEVQSAGSLLPALPDSFSATSTTVLINDATILKVRDNYLIGNSTGRFMRVKVMPAP